MDTTIPHVLVDHDDQGYARWTCMTDGCYRGQSGIHDQGDAQADARAHADDAHGGIPVRVVAQVAAGPIHIPTYADIPTDIDDHDRHDVYAVIYDVDVIGGWYSAAGALGVDVTDLAGWVTSGRVPHARLADLNRLASRNAGWTAAPAQLQAVA